MLLTDFLMDSSAVWDSIPVMSWDDVEPVFRHSDDPNEILRAAIGVCSVRTEIDPAHTDLIASTPLAAWVVGEMFFKEILKPSPLTLYKAIMKADEVAAKNTTIPEVVVLNELGLTRLYSDQLTDVMTGISHAEKFLELTEPYRWYSDDFLIAKYVLQAAVEGADGPIGPIGERIMFKYETRLVQGVEDVTIIDPDLTYSERLLLDYWYSEHP